MNSTPAVDGVAVEAEVGGGLQTVGGLRRFGISFNYIIGGRGEPFLSAEVPPPSAVTILPDDPRECCRLIRAALEPMDDWPIGALPEDFPGLVRALCEGEPDYLSDARGALNALADQARDSGRAYRVAFRRIAELSSHGARDLPREPGGGGR